MSAAGSDDAPRGVQASIDWYEASVKNTSVEWVAARLEEHLPTGFGFADLRILRDDDERFDGIGPLDLRVRADLVGQLNRRGEREPYVTIRLPGQLCRAVGTDAVLNLHAALSARRGWKISRIDVAIDDFDRSISPRKFATACVAGDLDDEKARVHRRVVTRVRGDNWEWSRRKGGCLWIGGRKSERLLRVYDKQAESSGAIRSVRFELQCRDESATTLAADLLAARAGGESLATVAMDHLVGFVDLRVPQGSRSSSQLWPRVDWWAKFVGAARAARIPRGDPTGAEQWLRALQRQSKGYVGVELRRAGVTSAEFASLPDDDSPAGKVLRAVRSIVGGELPKLSPEHGVRLGQLREMDGRRKRNRGR